jgi:hypothetical protein
VLKQCFKCKRVLARESFYAHPQMEDGLLGKCKDCTKQDVRENYKAKRTTISLYERQRNQTPERRAAKADYQRMHRLRNPEKAAARNAIYNALRDGKIVRPEFCGNCGRTAKVQAHHTDYSKPLDVVWLCFDCHRTYGHGQVVTQKEYQQGK